MCNIWIAIFWLFWLIFGQKIASHTCRSDFLHKWIVHKKFQLKIPTLSKNDCSATWKPNTNQKNFTRDQLRNVQRYQKYVVILWWFIFIVSDIFKPTVLCMKSLEILSMTLFLNFMIGGHTADSKDLKMPFVYFFQDIQNSFQWVIRISLQTHKFFSFWNFSTNMVA